jgi:hypothetical protein|tara:strand:- start:309 stop:680 length:372 start_codon:yes stop_codon:yes gene_type:complete
MMGMMTAMVMCVASCNYYANSITYKYIMATQFVSLMYNPNKQKEYTAVFTHAGRTQTVRFGAPKKTFIHGDISIKKRDEWRDKKKDYDYSTPTDITTLKRHLLYGRSHRLKKNYKKMRQLYEV